MSRYSCLILCCLAVGLGLADPIPKPTLKGVTIMNSPYAWKDENGQIKGLVVDLMDKIAEKAGFTYQLYFSPDGAYGTHINGKFSGMIGEVYNKKADFAIADLTITESRKQHITFTEPFMSNQLAALIHRKDALGLTTMEDLVKFNARIQKDDSPSDLISYSAIKGGATIYKLGKSADLVGKSIYDWLRANPSKMVTSLSKGIEQVKKGKFALIIESNSADYITGQNCNLTALIDNRGLYSRKFAIALPKNSTNLDSFNAAIKELKKNGEIEKLKEKYWANHCKTNTEEL